MMAAKEARNRFRVTIFLRKKKKETGQPKERKVVPIFKKKGVNQMKIHSMTTMTIRKIITNLSNNKK